MKKFALIGAAGYIAVRHLKAIKETNNTLVAALDKCDSVGILDSYFPEAHFFTEFERFDRHIDKLKRKNQQIDYLSICSPNYLHDAHISFALRSGINAICEKPLVINPWNLDRLAMLEKETNKKINTILQLRLHPNLIELKKKIDSTHSNKIFDVDLTYIASRGNWYFASWKGDIEKSGGVATNIGIHFFDMLTWIFGNIKSNIVHISEPKRASGFLQLERANVRWFLSVDIENIPSEIQAKGQRTFRSITVNGDEIEFSGGFTDLHTLSYQEILKGNGFGLEQARKSIEIAYAIRNSTPIGLVGDYHPFAKKEIDFHPFFNKKNHNKYFKNH